MPNNDVTPIIEGTMSYAGSVGVVTASEPPVCYFVVNAINLLFIYLY